jgi:uncharacterized protein
LNDVSGVGPKTFQQAAGFLRIREAEHPLDGTAVHPESYGVVEEMARLLGVQVADFIKDPALVERVPKAEFARSAGVFTLQDIVEELKKPGRDPRDQFVAPSFKEGVHEITDLQPGMVLEGVVTNVTKFGAFVDVGVHQDGLIHVSELSQRFVQDPGEAVKVGQIVKVQVLSADPKTKRIALSKKALESPVGRGPQRPPASQQRPPAPPKRTLEDSLAALSDRWKVK